MKMEYCYISFSVQNRAKLEALRRVVDEITKDMNSGRARGTEEWKAFFAAEDLQSFWWPSQQELKQWQERWDSTPFEKRANDPSLKHPWDFASMFEIILSSEYKIVGIRRCEDGTERLEFAPEAYPFGGTESLQALVKAFGHSVIGVDDGTGHVATERAQKQKKWWKFWRE